MDLPRLTPDAVARALAARAAGASSDYDLNPEVTALLPPGRVLRAAAVLVPLVERGARLTVLLTRRSARLRSHAGQVAFPGGRVDPGDPSLVAAALREAEEEIGLPAAAATILGELGRHETVTGFAVTPFVAAIDPGFRPRPDPAEVAEAFEVPLDFLLEPAHWQIHSRPWQGSERHYWVVPYGPHYIWGATARIIRSFVACLTPEP